MKIILTEGCVCDSLTIDGKEANKYSNEELRSIIKKVLELEKGKANLINLLNDVVDIFGECSTDTGMVKTDKYGLILATDQNEETDVITIDGKNVNRFNRDEIRDIIISVVNANNDTTNLIWALRGFIPNFGEYKFCYHCDECGDNVVEYKLNV